MPASLRKAALAIVVVAVIHLAAIFLILAHQQEIVDTIRRLHPGLTEQAFTQQYNSAVIGPSIVHVVFILLFLLLLWPLYRNPKRGTRLQATVLLVIQICAHATIPITISMVPSQAAAVIAVQGLSLLFELGALYLLWLPAESRAYFAANK